MVRCLNTKSICCPLNTVEEYQHHTWVIRQMCLLPSLLPNMHCSQQREFTFSDTLVATRKHLFILLNSATT